MLLIGEGLKRELSDGEFAVSQFDQTIEHGGNIAKACRQVLLHTMKDLLEMIDDGENTENALNHHAIIALAVLTKMPVDWFFPTLTEAQVAEDLSLLGPRRSDLPEVLVMRIGSRQFPVNDLPLWGNQQADFHPNNPAMFTDAFLANLTGAASFPTRMVQFIA